MKTKLAIVFAMITGCAIGATLPPATAQQTGHGYSARPTAQRWEQWCKLEGTWRRGEDARGTLERINNALRSAGQEGWELVGVPTPSGGSLSQHGGTNWSEVLLCFRRPVE